MSGIVSLGVLAMLSYLVPSCFRKKGEQLNESIPSPAVSAMPAETTQSANTTQEAEVGEKETPAVHSHSPIAIMYRSELKEYDFGPGSLYRGRRYGSFFRYLREKLPDKGNYGVFKAEFATDDDLLLICEPDYIDFNKRYFNAENTDWPVTEEFLKYHTLENKPEIGAGKVELAARLLVGQAKTAVDLIQSGRFKKAVSVGGGMHHAFRDHGEAFCIYNDVAYCASYLVERYGLDRVLILDIDAHAGNGTSDYYYDDPRVLLIDVHQDPETIYPATGFIDQIGAGDGKGYTINVPMPTEADYGCYERVFESIIEPVAREFQPQFIIWNGGADTHVADPMTNLGLKTEDFLKIGEKVRALAEICDGKAIRQIVSGYTPEILPIAWYGSIAGFAGFEQTEAEVPLREPTLREVILHSKTEAVIRKAKSRLRGYWQCLS